MLIAKVYLVAREPSLSEACNDSWCLSWWITTQGATIVFLVLLILTILIIIIVSTYWALSTCQALFYVWHDMYYWIFAIVMCNRCYYYLHFTDEGTQVRLIIPKLRPIWVAEGSKPTLWGFRALKQPLLYYLNFFHVSPSNKKEQLFYWRAKNHWN